MLYNQWIRPSKNLYDVAILVDSSPVSLLFSKSVLKMLNNKLKV